MKDLILFAFVAIATTSTSSFAQLEPKTKVCPVGWHAVNLTCILDAESKLEPKRPVLQVLNGSRYGAGSDPSNSVWFFNANIKVDERFSPTPWVSIKNHVFQLDPKSAQGSVYKFKDWMYGDSCIEKPEGNSPLKIHCGSCDLSGRSSDSKSREFAHLNDGKLFPEWDKKNEENLRELQGQLNSRELPVYEQPPGQPKCETHAVIQMNNSEQLVMRQCVGLGHGNQYFKVTGHSKVEQVTVDEKSSNRMTIGKAPENVELEEGDSMRVGEGNLWKIRVPGEQKVTPQGQKYYPPRAVGWNDIVFTSGSKEKLGDTVLTKIQEEEKKIASRGIPQGDNPLADRASICSEIFGEKAGGDGGNSNSVGGKTTAAPAMSDH